MRLVDSERVQQTGAIVSHVCQGIGNLGRKADLGHQGQLDQAGCLYPIEFLAEADVAIVISDYPEAVTGESFDQFVGPQCKLRAEPHDQQHRWIGRIAGFLVVDFDPVRCRLRHMPLPWFTESQVQPKSKALSIGSVRHKNNERVP